jgi:hypothetical protein
MREKMLGKPFHDTGLQKSLLLGTEYSVKLNFAFSEKAIQSQNASSRLQNPG